MGTYSMDLRDRVVSACAAGLGTRVEIAEQFDVSTAWIRRRQQRRRETGNYGPLPTRRGRKAALAGLSLTRLERLVQEQPDTTLTELRDRCGVSCSLAASCKTLQRLGYRRKERRCGPLSKTVPTSSVSVGSG